VIYPGIMPIYAVGSCGSIHFYAMKWLNAPTLREFLDGCLGVRGEQFFTETARLFARLARAVASLHSAGIVHLNIQPRSIFLSEPDRWILGGFGSARELEASKRVGLPPPGELIRHPAYAAPEQFLASESGELDVRSDIYSLGLVCYELLTGTLPFPQKSRDEVAKLKLTRKPPSLRSLLPQIPLALEAILRQALEKNLELRYESAGNLARDFERFADDRRPNTRGLKAQAPKISPPDGAKGLPDQSGDGGDDGDGGADDDFNFEMARTN
jgi:serine/threonine protein kinase